jgi:small GTP-binding protein
MNKEEIIKIQISRIEKEIRDTPYHKGTEHHHGILRARLSKLKDKLDGPANKGGGGGVGYAIRHSGDASIVLVGLPSVGKSTLLNKLTNAESKVGTYDFTTLGVVPGMMEYKGVNIQILDLPGIVEGASANKGFGKKVLSVIRASDLVVLMTDVDREDWLEKIEKEIYDSGMRLNVEVPKITVKKTHKGAVQIVDPYKSFDKEVVIGIAKELGFSNAIIQFEERINNIDRLVDGLIKTRKYMSAVKIITKVDTVNKKKIKELLRIEDDSLILMSANENIGVDDFKDKVWQGLGLVRIFLKKGKNVAADKKEPLIIKKGSNLDDVLKVLSNQMRDDINKAYIWGKKARFPGQEVSLTFPVFEGMEVYFGR